jgi:hypothetical protein
MRAEWNYLAGNDFGPQHRNMPVQNSINAESQHHFARRVQNPRAKWRVGFGSNRAARITAKSIEPHRPFSRLPLANTVT